MTGGQLTPPPEQGLEDAELLERASRSGRSVQEETALALLAGECPARYLRNGRTLSLTKQARLAGARVALAGCGGLGGHVLENLVRSGVGCIVVCDPDRFEATNANRQLLCTARSMGAVKAQEARKRAETVNPLVEVRAVEGLMTEELLDGAQAVIDCLGGTAHRAELQRLATTAKLPLVSAGVSGWTALISSTWPGETGLGEFMGASRESSEMVEGVLSPTVAFAASLQAAELVRILVGAAPALRGKLLMADLSKMLFTTVNLGVA